MNEVSERNGLPGLLTFNDFNNANVSRCLRWHPSGIDSWSLSDWAVAVTGELGEACNIIKKLNRIRDGLVGNQGDDNNAELLKSKLGKEFADVVIYMDLIATAAGISLAACIIQKFNEVSERNGFPERL
jgi:NTP pyrophosphatase (non-canonical NTP hydrolase)